MFHVRKLSNALVMAAGVAVTLWSASARAAETTATNRLRVMTYNIHHGRGSDNKIDLERIAAVIRQENPDLVALQEVDVRTRRSGGVDQVEELVRLTGLEGRFGKGRDFEGGDYGQAILSRRPIEVSDVHRLPGTVPGEADERIAVSARIAGKGEMPKLLFVGTHLHHQQEAHRLVQGKRLLEILEKEEKLPVLVAGDFNAEPKSESMKLWLTSWDDVTSPTALTYPADKPVKKIDWILRQKSVGWRLVSARVVEETAASDHRPVVAELEYAPQRMERSPN